MIYGYARVSTDGQSVDAQLRQLTEAGCEKVYREVASGARVHRAQLGRVLAALGPGDVLVVTRLDRLARSPSTGQPGEPEPPVPAHPALGHPERQRRFIGDARERRVLLQVRAKLLVAVEGTLAHPLGHLAQGCMGRGIRRSAWHDTAYAR